jgi:hypothetical protein
MAEYNNQSIDIDLEEMFNGLSEEDQEEFLVDMFQNLSDEDSRKRVVGDNIWYLDNDNAVDIIVQAFESLDVNRQKDAAERIADILTPEQREELIEYIKEG